MSFSLINKGLELVEQDFQSFNPALQSNKLKTNTSKGTDVKNGNKSKRSKANVKQHQFKRKSEEVFINRTVKSAFDSNKRGRVEDRTHSNIEILNNLDSKLGSNVNLDKVKEYNLNKLSKLTKTPPNSKKSKEASKSVFTEEDFERMNNEWLALM